MSAVDDYLTQFRAETTQNDWEIPSKITTNYLDDIHAGGRGWYTDSMNGYV